MRKKYIASAKSYLPPPKVLILGDTDVVFRVKLISTYFAFLDYLEKHNRVFFNLLLTQGKLYQHCAEVEKQAQQMFDTLIEQIKKTEGVTEQLKEAISVRELKKKSKVGKVCKK